MDIHLSADQLLRGRLASSLGLDKYSDLILSYQKTDVSTDLEFQRKFNAFYMIRRNEEWRRKYYTLFEANKNSSPSFPYILMQLYELTGNVEASYASKMVATINPCLPIWDQYVLQNLGFRLTGYKTEDKLLHAINIYNEILQWYKDYLQTPEAKENIAIFNRWLPDYSWLSDEKKIDFMLWSRRA